MASSYVRRVGALEATIGRGVCLERCEKCQAGDFLSSLRGEDPEPCDGPTGADWGCRSQYLQRCRSCHGDCDRQKDPRRVVYRRGPRHGLRRRPNVGRGKPRQFTAGSRGRRQQVRARPRARRRRVVMPGAEVSDLPFGRSRECCGIWATAKSVDDDRGTASRHRSRAKSRESVLGDGVCPPEGCGRCLVRQLLARIRRTEPPRYDNRPGSTYDGLLEFTFAERQTLRAMVEAERKRRKLEPPPPATSSPETPEALQQTRP